MLLGCDTHHHLPLIVQPWQNVNSRSATHTFLVGRGGGGGGGGGLGITAEEGIGEVLLAHDIPSCSDFFI